MNARIWDGKRFDMQISVEHTDILDVKQQQHNFVTLLLIVREDSIIFFSNRIHFIIALVARTWDICWSVGIFVGLRFNDRRYQLISRMHYNACCILHYVSQSNNPLMGWSSIWKLPPFHYFHFFLNYGNNCYLPNTTLIFDNWDHVWGNAKNTDVHLLRN